MRIRKSTVFRNRHRKQYHYYQRQPAERFTDIFMYTNDTNRSIRIGCTVETNLKDKSFRQHRLQWHCAIIKNVSNLLDGTNKIEILASFRLEVSSMTI